MLSPEEFLAKAKKERKFITEGADRRLVAKLLRQLAPAFGFTKHLVSRAWDESAGGDLLAEAKRDQEEGHLVPEGLRIGGHKGLSYGDILAAKFHEKVWWKKFIKHVAETGTAIWVLPIQGAGYWVIHNTTINPDKRRNAVEIPAQVMGLNHIQVIRLELFVEEKKYD